MKKNCCERPVKKTWADYIISAAVKFVLLCLLGSAVIGTGRLFLRLLGVI